MGQLLPLIAPIPARGRTGRTQGSCERGEHRVVAFVIDVELNVQCDGSARWRGCVFQSLWFDNLEPATHKLKIKLSSTQHIWQWRPLLSTHLFPQALSTVAQSSLQKKVPGLQWWHHPVVEVQGAPQCTLSTTLRASPGEASQTLLTVFVFPPKRRKPMRRLLRSPGMEVQGVHGWLVGLAHLQWWGSQRRDA